MSDIFIFLGNSFIDPQEIDNLNCDAENHNDVNNLSANANDNITFVKNDVYDTNQSSFTGKEDYDNNYPDGKEDNDIYHQPIHFLIYKHIAITRQILVFISISF